ncbi:hypothetical protein Dsin_023671 [Dipteronia sinensis]|uniref:Uncharacterized protein n=1 Tax=Dipteronia sinensis TaxID=43782 RepID=A0AAE0A5B9_9ROSI|nr:hypothetical protein Dsin_023671 [Dipteronia sinensis]
MMTRSIPWTAFSCPEGMLQDCLLIETDASLTGWGKENEYGHKSTEMTLQSTEKIYIANTKACKATTIKQFPSPTLRNGDPMHAPIWVSRPHLPIASLRSPYPISESPVVLRHL